MLPLLLREAWSLLHDVAFHTWKGPHSLRLQEAQGPMTSFPRVLPAVHTHRPWPPRVQARGSGNAASETAPARGGGALTRGIHCTCGCGFLPFLISKRDYEHILCRLIYPFHAHLTESSSIEQMNDKRDSPAYYKHPSEPEARPPERVAGIWVITATLPSSHGAECLKAFSAPAQSRPVLAVSSPP